MRSTPSAVHTIAAHSTSALPRRPPAAPCAGLRHTAIAGHSLNLLGQLPALRLLSLEGAWGLRSLDWLKASDAVHSHAHQLAVVPPSAVQVLAVVVNAAWAAVA